jgi:twitching motility protein PilT
MSLHFKNVRTRWHPPATTAGLRLRPEREKAVNTPAVAACIRDGKTFMLNGVMQTGKNVGMITMDDSLRGLYSKGLISREECESRAEDKQLMRAFFQS